MTKYKGIKVNGVKKDEHRHIMEQYLGRELRRDEVVHHVNGDCRDNRIENLVVMPLSEHTHLHHINREQPEHVRKAQSERMKGKPNMHQRKLTDNDIRYIRSNYIPEDKEFGARALAKKFGTSHPTMIRILKGERYRDV